MEANVHTCTGTRKQIHTRARMLDAMLRKVTRRLSNSCLWSVPRIVTVESARIDCSGQKFSLYHFYVPTWCKLTTKRISNTSDPLVKGADHLWCCWGTLQKTFSSFINKGEEGVWALSLASSKVEACFDCHHLLSSLPLSPMPSPVKCSHRVWGDEGCAARRWSAKVSSQVLRSSILWKYFYSGLVWKFLAGFSSVVLWSGQWLPMWSFLFTIFMPHSHQLHGECVFLWRISVRHTLVNSTLTWSLLLYKFPYLMP